MFLEQISKNREEAFKQLIKRKNADEETFFIDEDGYYCYRTKRGLLKTYVYFDSFETYRKSDFYPEKEERVNGFYFVSLL